jgi:enoyl-CoA hydratase/carnithine racemase
MTEQTVLYSTQGAVALITLNRPQALNSFTRQMHKELWASLDRIEADPSIRACVITGSGRGFCAGADLAEFDFEPGPDLVRRADPGPVIDQAFNPTVRKLQALRVPTVAAVNGVAAGAGAQRQLHPGLQPDRAGAGRRRHMVPDQAARAGAGAWRGDAGRQGQRQRCEGVGNDLGRRR